MFAAGGAKSGEKWQEMGKMQTLVLFLLAFCNLGYKPVNLVSGHSRARCLPVVDRKCTNSGFFFPPSTFYSCNFGIVTQPVKLVFGYCTATSCL